MSRRNLANLIVGVLCFALVACSGQSPVTPTASAALGGDLRARPAQAALGTYELSFITTGHQPVVDSTLTVNQELALKGRVADSAGLPAQHGSIIFEKCSLKGALAPRANCDSGLGTWKHMMSIEVNILGEAYGHFGYCSSPRTIGFRFRYSSQGSGIASATSESKDATWVAVQ